MAGDGGVGGGGGKVGFGRGAYLELRDGGDAAVGGLPVGGEG